MPGLTSDGIRTLDTNETPAELAATGSTERDGQTGISGAPVGPTMSLVRLAPRLLVSSDSVTTPASSATASAKYRPGVIPAGMGTMRLTLCVAPAVTAPTATVPRSKAPATLLLTLPRNKREIDAGAWPGAVPRFFTTCV